MMNRVRLLYLTNQNPPFFYIASKNIRYRLNISIMEYTQIEASYIASIIFFKGAQTQMEFLSERLPLPMRE